MDTKCPRCEGTGKVNSYPNGGNQPAVIVDCPTCNGTAIVMIDKTVRAVANYFKYDDTSWFIKKFCNLTGDKGVKTAEKYLDWAKSGQRNCGSDFSYWAYDGDQQMAKAMIQVFIYTKSGKYLKEIPAPPELDRDSVPKTTHGTPLWSRRWASGGISWICCLFEYLNGKEPPRYAKMFLDKTEIIEEGDEYDLTTAQSSHFGTP